MGDPISLPMKENMVNRNYVIPISTDLGVTEVSSAMRRATQSKIDEAKRGLENAEDYVKRIVSRRKCFSFLPVLCSNDMVHGAWYWVWGSALATLIPVFPLISLYQNLFNVAELLPIVEHVAAYGMLIFCGIFFTVGSIIFVRAVEEPRKEPLSTCYHFSTDELMSVWMFFIGTVPSIPILALYTYYDPTHMIYRASLIIAIIVTIATYLFVLACYPSKQGEEKEYCAHHIRRCTRDGSLLHIHCASDWLIATWLMTIGCAIGIVAAGCFLAYFVYHGDHREIYNYTTGLFDCILFFMGSAYWVAGSYPVEPDLVQNIEMASVPSSSMDSKDVERGNNNNNNNYNNAVAVATRPLDIDQNSNGRAPQIPGRVVSPAASVSVMVSSKSASNTAQQATTVATLVSQEQKNNIEDEILSPSTSGGGAMELVSVSSLESLQINN